MPATFPYDLLTLRVRINNTPDKICIFCQQEATYILDHFINDLPRILKENGGVFDIDAMWREAIHRQVEGNYEIVYYQPVCLNCCVHFASIQLGRWRPIQYLLTMLSIAKKQQGVDLSLAIMCTVRSYNDEGDTWAVNAPSLDLEEVVKHAKSRGMDPSKEAEPLKNEEIEAWKKRTKRIHRINELRAQIAGVNEMLDFYRSKYREIAQKEEAKGKTYMIFRDVLYGLFGKLLDKPEMTAIYEDILVLNQQLEALKAEEQALTQEVEKQG